MGIQVNRFDELIAAVERTANMDRLLGVSGNIVEEQTEFAQRELYEFSPRITPGTFMSTGHNHTPISEGWARLPQELSSDSVAVTIVNTSEHVRVQREGTTRKNYPITPRQSSAYGTRLFPGGSRYNLGSRLFFWIGPPLRWPVRAASFRKGGWAWMTKVEHPGFGPWGGRDFVLDAAEAAQDILVDIFRLSGRDEYLRPLRRFFR